MEIWVFVCRASITGPPQRNKDVGVGSSPNGSKYVFHQCFLPKTLGTRTQIFVFDNRTLLFFVRKLDGCVSVVVVVAVVVCICLYPDVRFWFRWGKRNFYTPIAPIAEFIL